MRIRSVFPGFWTSLTLAQLPREVRLAFIALWNYADDDGRENCNYQLLKSALFPLDDDVTPTVLDDWIGQMERLGLVSRYEAEGRVYYSVTSWKEYQHPNKPKKSKHPAPGTYAEGTTKVRRTEPSRVGGGREGKGKEGITTLRPTGVLPVNLGLSHLGVARG